MFCAGIKTDLNKLPLLKDCCFKPHFPVKADVNSIERVSFIFNICWTIDLWKRREILWFVRRIPMDLGENS